MKSISTSLQNHMLGELTTLATLVKITRTDDEIIAFTTHDMDLTFDDVLYHACGSFTGSKLTQASDLKTNDYEATGVLDSEYISDEDVQKGLFDHARVDIYICNWRNLSQGVLQLRRGWLGEVVLKDGSYVASFRGLHDLLSQKVGETYTPECRYDLGDDRCCVDLSDKKVTGSVTGVTSNQAFMDYKIDADTDTYNDGVLTWTSGANTGQKIEIYKWDLGELTFTLWLPMQYDISVGDAYEVVPGCDKRFSTCRNVFDNAVNYGGFPYLPGIGKILNYPDAR